MNREPVSGDDGAADVAPEPATRPMRVLHLDHTSAAGGAEYALLRMLQAGPRWAPFLLMAPPEDRHERGIYDAIPARVPRRIGGVRQPAGASSGGRLTALVVGVRVLVQAAAVRSSRAFLSADLVDANTARAAAYGAFAVRGTRRAFVVHLRDLVDPGALGRSGHALMTRVVLPRADGVVANSRATLESARPFLRAGVPAEVIPSASGLLVRGARGGADGATAATAAPGVGGPIRAVGLLARIDPWKGQELLLEAFARVFRGRDTRLQLAGGAPFGHEAFAETLRRRAAELGVGAQLDLPGHVADVGALLSGWDVAVQASTRPEPLGQNVLQYLATGRAVVVADEGGPAEWVEDGVNGLVVPPRDVDALADALARLDADPDLRARLASAAAATPGLLDDAAVTRAHEAFYARVLASVAVRRAAASRRSR
ncbi:glycosyltransferase [Agromyces sp. NPDC056523]|uniref:glycosyltransferase n=1 Tax=Agromyces sp. NPDC056523 TaxID=3345850 RepID=UPI00366D147E